jgi:hypothetical protein
MVVNHGIAGNGIQQGRILACITVFFQISRKALLQDVARKVVIPRAPHQVCKKPVPVLAIKFLEISHSSI